MVGLSVCEQRRNSHQSALGSTEIVETGVPLAVQIERQINAEDPTSRAIHRQRLEAEAKKQLRAHRFGKRRWNW
jgi:hypothetical protein